MKTFQLKCDEDEVKAILAYHLSMHHDSLPQGNISIDRSKRIHDLTKRLNKDDGAEEVKNDDTEEANDVSKVASEGTASVPKAWA